MALMATFQDPLTGTSLNTNFWTQTTVSGGTASYTSVGASMNYPNPTNTSNDADIASVATYNLTGSFARVCVTNAPQGANSDATFRLEAGSTTNEVHWQNEGTNLFAAYIVGGSQTILATLTYDATAHAWWQIREKGGTTYWETSIDGVNWTTQASTANKITLTSLTVDLAASSFGSDSNLMPFSFRYFNYPLPGTTTSTSSTSISSTSTSISSTSTSTSSTSLSASTTSQSTSSTSTSVSSTSTSVSSTSSSFSSTSISSTSSSTSLSSTSSSISSTSLSSTSTSSTSTSISISSTSSSFSSTSSSVSSTSASTSSTSFSSTSSSSSTSTTTLPPPYLSYVNGYNTIQAVPLTTSGTSVSATSFTTASVSPAANTLILAFICSTHSASGTVDPTSLSGNGLTWVMITSRANILGSQSLSVWRAMGTNPTPGTITINWDSSQTGDWSIIQYPGTDTSGANGSGAIGNTNALVAISAVHGFVLGLSFSSPSSIGVGAIKAPDHVVGSNGLTMTGESRVAVGMASGFANSDYPNAQFTWNTANSNVNGVAVELKAARLTANSTNAFNSVNYGDVSVDDGDYFIQQGSKALIQEYKDTHQNNTDNITFTWKGRSTVSTLVSHILIQIYNVSSLAWETLANVNTVPADTDTTVTVNQTANLANYYDTTNTVTFRSYQQVN